MARDKKGRYDYSNTALICICGHPLSVHSGENDTKTRPCFNEDCGDKNECSCTNFKHDKGRKRN